MDNWKDERCVAAEGDFDDATGQVFALLRAMEAGEGVETARAEVVTAVGLGYEADLLRMQLLGRRLESTEAELAGRSGEAAAKMQALETTLAELASISTALDTEWAQLRELPVLLEQHNKCASLAKWRSKLSDDKQANADSVFKLAEATAMAEQLRTSYHFLLHKLSHVATASERLVCIFFVFLSREGYFKPTSPPKKITNSGWGEMTSSNKLVETSAAVAPR